MAPILSVFNMEISESNKIELKQKGFATINGLYNNEETAAMIAAIDRADQAKNTFRRASELFAIRQLFKEVPELMPVVFNTQLKQLVQEVFGPDYFIVKSIYFDKPESANWYVAYHQDLMIAVDKKLQLEHFGPWTVKHNQYSVQPPVALLERNFTIRIHLDDTDAEWCTQNYRSVSFKKNLPPGNNRSWVRTRNDLPGREGGSYDYETATPA